MPKNSDTLVEKLLDPQILEKLHNRKLTGRALSSQLGVSETHLSRTLSREGFTKLPGPVLELRKRNSMLFQSRAAHRTHLAAMVVANEMTLPKAAAKANCTE